MFVYYQTVEDSQNQKWLAVPFAQADQVRREKAFHMSIYQVSEQIGDQFSADDIAYKGDLWVDIDHKPTDDSTEAKRLALKAAIMDARRLMSWLESVHVAPKQCRLFASGSKGFHVGIPGKLFDVTKAVKFLPRIHKYMAHIIATRAAITGMDMSLYAMGKGKLLRVENKVRANGKYKVPISYEELKILTPEMYLDLTSAPKPETLYAPEGYSEELRNLYVEGKETIGSLRKYAYQAVPSAQMAVFSDANHPTCVQWITEHNNIREGSGLFNDAKMSLARYVMSAPITDRERNTLVDTFANNWTSHRCPTVDGRRKAVLETLKFGQDQGFSCKYMTGVLTESPCQGCRLVQEQRRAQADAVPIEATSLGYFRQVPRGLGPRLTNFTLHPDCVIIDEDADSNMFSALEYRLIRASDTEDAPDSGIIVLTHRAWQSASEFKKQTSIYKGLTWHGNDSDLQHLKDLLTNPLVLTGVKHVRQVTSVGIHRDVDEKLGIDGYVWVEEKFSLNSEKVANTYRFIGHSYASGGERTLRLHSVPRYDGRTDHESSETLLQLLQINPFEIIAPSLGWMFACWLRTHIRHANWADKHLPSLQYYGSAGKGKTDSSELLCLLAGADYVQGGSAMTITNSTPYTLRVEAASRTTVPLIFDEFNEQRGSDRKKYEQAYEVIKAAARGSAMSRGGIKDGDTVIQQQFALAPIMSLATQINAKMEINDRSIAVHITDVGRTEQHAQNFVNARSNSKKLIPVARLAMETTIGLESAWVLEALERARVSLPKAMQVNRSSRNWQIVLVGLDYLQYVLQKGYAPKNILDIVRNYRQDTVDWLRQTQGDLVTRAKREEVDIIIEVFGQMIAHDMGAVQRKFTLGHNYIIKDDTLHIWTHMFFLHYLKFCREVLNRTPEMNNIQQFELLLKTQPYNLGPGLVPAGTPATSGWHSLSLSLMRAKGLSVDNFLVDYHEE